MIRLVGILKVSAVLLADFLAISAMFNNDVVIASIMTGAVGLYAWLGGYYLLFKEGAIRWDKLPAYESARLTDAKLQLTEDVKRASSVDISNLKLYLIPDDYGTQATAYGANCVSVSSGTFKNTDPMTLNAVLGHEISHILNCDAEFNRAVLATILLLTLSLSVVSFVFVAIVFFIFIACNFFKSWQGMLAFTGTKKAVKGLFKFLQTSIVMIYMAVSECLNRFVEYRCDRYSASLDASYGLQLANFLSYGASENSEAYRQLSFTEALYRSHPPAAKRIARLQAYMIENQSHKQIDEK